MTEGYPKKMTHPAFRPAVISNSRNPNTASQGQPIRFPPVWVNNQDQEEYHKAQGYRVTG